MATEFDEGRCWYKKSGKKILIGLTDVAFQEIGDIQRVQAPYEGDVFEEGDVIAEVEGTQGVLEVIAPLAGTVSEVNEVLQEAPEVIAQDPMGEGWLVKFSTTEVVEDADEEESSE